MISNIKKQYIVFEINNKDLQSKNVHLFESELIFDNNEYYIVHKKLDNLNIFITYKNIGGDKKKIYSKFIRGYIYKDNIEYNIKSFNLYSSLQIGEWAYDNIGICSIDDTKDTKDDIF